MMLGSRTSIGGLPGASGSTGAPSDRARSFAQNWIAQNIEVDAFSWNDPPIYDAPLANFREAGAQLGIGEAELAAAIGPVPQFIADAYARAAERWRDRTGADAQAVSPATPKPAPHKDIKMTKVPSIASAGPGPVPDKSAPDPAVDRPGFDLGGSTGETIAGLGLGLGNNSSDTKLERSLPGRRFTGTLGIPRWRGSDLP